MKHLSFILAICFAPFAYGQTDWKKAKEKDGILIYTRTYEENDLKEFRAHMSIEARFETIVALITEASHYPNWVYKVSTCEVLEDQLPRTSKTYYTVAMPWPLKNRDGVTTSTVLQKANGHVVVRQTDAPEHLPEKEGYVRLKQVDTTWTIEDKGDGNISLIYQSLADPDGVPNWLVNLFLLDGPQETLKNLRKEVSNPSYANIEVSWLK